MKARVVLTGGLVMMTGPLPFMAMAQSGYVDVEAERAAARAAGQAPATTTAAPTDPYGAKPAQAYPATSYGVNSAPTSATATTTAAPATTTAAPPGGPGGSSLGSLVLQVQQLQQEVMRLNGKVEEQAHELRMLKEQSMQRYVDLDRRLSEGGTAAPAAAGSSAAAAPVVAPVAPAPVSSNVSVQAGEAEAYNAAYAMVRSRQFDNAVLAFRQFLQDFPGGRYAPNAHYWLGELYLVIEPRDLESARQSFALLVSQYPDHNKTPDALYKLGKVQFEKGNREKAREYFDLVINQYSASNASVADLARKFIAENY
ncbi:MAG: tol-pal system protein YbgF [Halioglobus sp.]